MSTLIATNPLPFPTGDKLVLGRDRQKYPDARQQDPSEYLINPLWLDVFNQQSQVIAASSVTINRVSEPNLNAAVVTTDLAGAALVGGLYEAKAYQRIKTADGVSSSTQITIGWTDGGVIQSETFTALTGDTTTTKLTGASKTFRADPSTPITYAVSYASNTPAKMHYEIDLVLSRVAA